MSTSLSCKAFGILREESTKLWPQLIKRWIPPSTSLISIQWLVILVLLILIRWIVIYPVDSTLFEQAGPDGKWMGLRKATKKTSQGVGRMFYSC